MEEPFRVPLVAALMSASPLWVIVVVVGGLGCAEIV